MQIINKITVIILTYKTDKKILYKCLKSINKNIKILIVENSKKFENKNFFLNNFKNLRIICSGENLGYARGNNYGLNKIRTKYALILNPDTKLKSNFFKNLSMVIKKTENFYLIGCNHVNNKKILPAGYFNDQKNKDFERIINTKKIDFLTKVEWIRGFSMIINLKKFKKNEIFDKNYFLYFEEIDLCKSIQKRLGNIYFVKSLEVNHLGFKSSIGSLKSKNNHAENLRNWHYMWSSFYFYKKNYSYLTALKKMLGKLIRAAFKTLFYYFTFQTAKKEKYLHRFLGISCSLLGMKSFYRIEN
tara:strand:+ start:903 stop:1808 length:906 start_codon:yes stop_codon:yes gene_type:complete